METYVYILLAGWLALLIKVRCDYLRAYKRYIITYNGYYWIVRDKRGRFVTITDNYWNICRLGA